MIKTISRGLVFAALGAVAACAAPAKAFPPAGSTAPQAVSIISPVLEQDQTQLAPDPVIAADDVAAPVQVAAAHGSQPGGGAPPPGYVVANFPNAACEQVPTVWGGSGSGGGGTTYYVDPVSGNNSNNGLAGHPEQTLAAALADIATGADTIVLEGGNYGTGFTITNSVKAGWTRIMADTGQVPVFTSLDMSGSQRWLIQGVKIQNAPGAPNTDALVNIGHGSGTAKNIVLDSNNISTADDGSAWSQATWKNANFYGVLLYGSTETSHDVNCIGFSRNLVAYVRTNLVTNGQYLLIADNQFSNPGWDAMDPMGDDVNIVRNYVHDTHDVDWTGPVADPLGNTADHVDGIQLQVGECSAAYCVRHRFLIDGNVFVERTSPSITTSTEDVPAQMDGIAIWDEALDGFTITNNLIITSSSNPITVGNVYNGIICNNTVIATDNSGTDSGHYAINVGLHGNSNPVGAPASHDVRVCNNAASNISIEGPEATITADHNDILAGGWFSWYNGGVEFDKTAGVWDGSNTIRSQALTSYFVTYDYSTRTWDVHLKAGSLGIGAGTATGAPNKADGTPRTGTVDVGRY